MHAITFDAPGDEAVLVWSDAPDAVAGPGEVLIAVAAAGINNADLLQRRGHYPVPQGASPILGLECSGTIAAVGEGVSDWHVGDRVCALLSGGGYAELVAVPAAQVLPVPDDLDLVAAAGLPEAACTVYSNVGMIAGLRPGQSLLVHGGGSGMGSHAIQWAHALGARVFATAGSTPKLEAARRFGADVVINHRDEDFVTVVREQTDGAGVDVVLDIVGPTYLQRNLEALAVNGHLVVIGSTGSAPDAPLDLGLLMRKRASVTATTLRARPAEEKAEIVASVRREVWPFVERGRVAPVVDTVLPMAQAADAHRLVAEGATIGKVLLTP
ncbi:MULTISPECIES: NAD(P)H-quinone oxidoreductase [unclassified Curtobacterium]|uniref:NAD(P)H-quinone oxidoreductase n=1 Tax=unclassified Curtobacterium TaxID=257496 RepID=UPI000DA7AA10|nr:MULTISPECIES: NAD(P)H-quinone oxidoreductase [unclassified Curtobacterium]PZE74782.1 NAD(P)H-quinone oxidoreductase [Curtobacterium sp. MCBD17_019]WIE54154.1 NAD(P)H-quinone oxidoreductase [Curtobacterium sp. MCBD17_003]